jgi:hypothetical protein
MKKKEEDTIKINFFVRSWTVDLFIIVKFNLNDTYFMRLFTNCMLMAAVAVDQLFVTNPRALQDLHPNQQHGSHPLQQQSHQHHQLHGSHPHQQQQEEESFR